VSADYVRLCKEYKLEQVESDVNPKVRKFATEADKALTDVKNIQRTLLKDSQARAESLRAQSAFVNILMSCLLLAIVVVAVVVCGASTGPSPQP
jgi:hypothetical protein